MSKRVYFMGCAFLAISAFAITPTNLEDKILGTWEVTDGYCEHGSKVLPDFEIPAGHFGRMTFHKENIMIVALKSDFGGGKVCTINMKTKYFINGDQLTMATPIEETISPDCPEINPMLKMLAQSSNQRANNTLDISEFKISPDGQKLYAFTPGNGLCDKNGRNVGEYTRIQQ